MGSQVDILTSSTQPSHSAIPLNIRFFFDMFVVKVKSRFITPFFWVLSKLFIARSRCLHVFAS